MIGLIFLAVIIFIIFNKQIAFLSLRYLSPPQPPMAFSIKPGTFLNQVTPVKIGERVHCGTVVTLPLPENFEIFKIPDDLKGNEEIHAICSFNNNQSSQSYSINFKNDSLQREIGYISDILTEITKTDTSDFYRNILSDLNGSKSLFEKYKTVLDSLSVEPGFFEWTRNVYYFTASKIIAIAWIIKPNQMEYQVIDGFTLVKSKKNQSAHANTYLMFTPENDLYEIVFSQSDVEVGQEALPYLKSLMKKNLISVNTEELKKIKEKSDKEYNRQLENIKKQSQKTQ